MGDGFANGVIRLENEPRAVFYAGQEITGSVLFELSQPLSFSVLTLTFTGEANVLWTENQKEEYNNVAVQRLVKYIGHEEYFKFTEFLAGGQGISKLPAGSRCFPFKYRIPFTAPSTFSGEKGSVSYSITACLVNSDPMMLNEELVKDFQVIAPMDLNAGPPNINRPIEMEFEEVFGCDCICSPEPMTIRLRLPGAGYCPGQVVPVSVHIENNSTTEINKIIFQLTSRERYRSRQPIAEYMPAEKVLTTYKSGAILGKSQRNFTCDLTVPDMIAPNLENCSIIDVGYFFKIRIKLSGCSDDLKDDSEIYIGLIPLVGSVYIHPLSHLLPISGLPNPSKQYEPAEPINPAFVEPTDTPYSPNNNGIQNTLYPPKPSPYPSPNVPQVSPKMVIPSHISSYPSQNPPYPAGGSPYPPPKVSNPQNSPYPAPSSYPTHSSPYPTQNSPYPLQNASHAGATSPYPTGPKSPYPVGPTSPYPADGNSPYPAGTNSPYPTGPKSPYPAGGNSPYPAGTNSPYPASAKSPHLVGTHSPYPAGASSPYPTGPKSPYPTGPNSDPKSPYPAGTSPYPASGKSPYPPNTSDNEQCPAENPSYPSKSPPYPVENKTENPVTEAKPPGYQIGFITPERVASPIQSINGPGVSPPYPLTNVMPGVSPPYPVTNNMPGVPGERDNATERDLRIYLPPISPHVEPSAPPPSS